MPEYKSATRITLSTYTGTIECPYCGHHNSGWLSDPRGGDSECDECEETYLIPENLEIKLN